jgi:glycosyltransferase involved in cell wall biosynthesis
LVRTLASVRNEIPVDSEVIVVDGSDSPQPPADLQLVVGSDVPIVVLRSVPNGVFPALNTGIAASKGDWIITLTAGDRLMAGCRGLLDALSDSKFDAEVFAQEVTDPDGNFLYLFQPDARSVWPHQSVVLKREVYLGNGFYPTQFRYSGDQQYFAAIRKRVKYVVRTKVLTSYCLGGMSSGASVRHSKEIYLLRRELGESRVQSLWRAAISTNIRYLLENIVGYRLTAKLKTRMFSVLRRSH